MHIPSVECEWIICCEDQNRPPNTPTVVNAQEEMTN